MWQNSWHRWVRSLHSHDGRLLFYYREKLDRRYLWRWVCPERYSRIQKIYAGLQGRDMGGYSGSAASLYDSGGQGKTVPDGQRDVSGSPGTKSKAGQRRERDQKMAFDYKKEYKEFYLPGKQPQIVEIPKMNFIAVRGERRSKRRRRGL